MKMMKKVIEVPMGKVEITHNYFEARELSALDCRLKEYRIKRQSLAPNEKGFVVQVFAAWSKADVAEFVDDALNNILTTFVRVEDSVGNWSTFVFQWSPKAYAIQQELLDIMKKEGIEAPKASPKFRDVETAAKMDFWRQADYNRKLLKALKTLEQDPSGGSIAFKVQATEYVVSLTADGFVIKRGGRFFKKIFDKNILTGAKIYDTIQSTKGGER